MSSAWHYVVEKWDFTIIYTKYNTRKILFNAQSIYIIDHHTLVFQ